MSEHSQFVLMKSNRFLPLFITQFFGAFNDNVFKNALIIMLAFNSSLLPKGISEGLAVNISAGLFILPFFLFSSLAGQLADYNEKSSLIRKLKVIEIGLVVLCSLALIFKNVYLMWLGLFLLGTQSTFFGPIKYSILPQHLLEKELVGGNSLIEMGTFLSILIGTITGGVLISMNNGTYYICASLFISGIIGIISAYKIPDAQPSVKGKLDFNIFKQSVEIIRISKETKSVFLSILGISWFWFLGATFIAQFPLLVKDVLQSHENTVTVLLMVFSIGIAAGSLICEKLSRGKIEPGLVPFGAIGMTIFGLYLYLALVSFTEARIAITDTVLTISQFLSFIPSFHVLVSLFFLSFFGGFFTVPLYAMIQSRSKPENRSRTIAANNIINSIFMIASAIFAILCLSLNISVTTLIGITILLNALVSIYIFTIIPEFMMRFLVWILICTVYRIKVKGAENIPDEVAAIIVANHISFIDAILIFGAVTRPIKFVMYYKIYDHPIMRPLFNSIGAIPIAGKSENEEVFNTAFKIINTYLQNGEIVMIFPEGKIAQIEEIGKIQDFKAGILKTINNTPVQVIPSALSGLWGSMFTRKEKSMLRYIPKSFFNRNVTYNIGKPIPPNTVTLKILEEQVIQLRDNSKI